MSRSTAVHAEADRQLDSSQGSNVCNLNVAATTKDSPESSAGRALKSDNGAEGVIRWRSSMLSAPWRNDQMTKNASTEDERRRVPLVFQRFQSATFMGSDVPGDYSEISDTPFVFYLADMSARMVAILLNSVVWGWGNLATGAAWPYAMPGFILTAVLTTETVAVHRIGPVRLCQSRLVVLSMAIQTCAYFWNSVWPLFLPIEQKPFGSRIVLLASSAGIAFFVGIYFQLYAFVILRQYGHLLPKLDVFRHALLKGCTRVLRFTDGFTDLEVSASLLRHAQTGVCFWRDGTSRCGRYWVMVVVSIACAFLDLNVAIVFLTAGRLFDSESKRIRRVVACLHTVSLSAEAALLTMNVIHALNKQAARKLGDVEGKLWEDVVFLAVSFSLTVVSFCVNLAGIHAVVTSAKRIISRVSASVPARMSTGWAGTRSRLPSGPGSTHEEVGLSSAELPRAPVEVAIESDVLQEKGHLL